MERFIPREVRDAWKQEFENLTQEDMSVWQYEAKFSRLIRYAP